MCAATPASLTTIYDFSGGRGGGGFNKFGGGKCQTWEASFQFTLNGLFD
jgi:hypothetical protein